MFRPRLQTAAQKGAIAPSPPPEQNLPEQNPDAAREPSRSDVYDANYRLIQPPPAEPSRRREPEPTGLPKPSNPPRSSEEWDIESDLDW
ncbi:MAG: hypothetical protein HC824_02685 [Synechococcales cyanobacterium RM1_1_8]|nr:hypothetical protein [Synechococcales cyanobacterium RM1_1_8]